MNDPLERVNRFFDEYLTPACKLILYINAGVYLLGIIVALVFNRSLALFGSLLPLPYTFHQPWGVATYMWLHASPMHLLFNMLGLWFFGPPLENRWGTKRFWQFYLFVGIVAGVLDVVIPVDRSIVIGASGAIYGLILAMTVYNPNGLVLFYFVPMQMKVMLGIAIGYAVLMLLSPGGDGTSHFTHLMGLAAAYVWLALYHKDWDFHTWRWR